MQHDFPNVAIVLYDDLKPISTPIAQNLIDLTEFKLCGKYRFNIIHTKNITETIGKCVNDGFEWAVVVAAGNFLQDQILAIKTIEHAKAEGAPLACHILDRGGYYHLHPQWFAIDLKIYDQVGRPAFEEKTGAQTFVTRKTQRCLDNAHDGYTPWWVKPDSDEQVEYTSDYGYFGIDVIAAMVRAGHTVTNIPNDIRNRKNYCYPEHNHDELMMLLNDPDYQPRDPNGPLWWFAHALHQLVNNLRRGYYVLNTEHLDLNALVGKKFDRFAGVCGGVKPACIVGKGNFSSGGHVYLFDIGDAAILWQKHLLANWDGDFSKFENIWKDFQNQHPDFHPMYYNNESIDTNIDWFLNNAGMTREEFQQCWGRYQSMKHEFVVLNLLNDDAAQKLADMVNDGTSAYIWTSNAFVMDYLMFFKTRRWTENRSREFVEQLQSAVKIPTVLENCGHSTVM